MSIFTWETMRSRMKSEYSVGVEQIQARTDLTPSAKHRAARELGYKVLCDSYAMMGVAYRPPRSDWGLE